MHPYYITLHDKEHTMLAQAADWFKAFPCCVCFLHLSGVLSMGPWTAQ